MKINLFQPLINVAPTYAQGPNRPLIYMCVCVCEHAHVCLHPYLYPLPPEPDLKAQ